jgi:phosphoenolpyruvate synthase/pyruvate phosphate dikinase
MDLYERDILDLREVNAALSGKVCGPKAANLGQLKQLFPEQVTEGLVIPFGVFRQHLEQTMPGRKVSYWDFLTGIFKQGRKMKASGLPAAEVERYILGELAVLREAIQQINLMPDFIAGLKRGFYRAFGKELGQVPVFLRSDTNMEDLKDFTGAGLNLTVFNVLKEEKIWQAVRDVWASPYTERSYKWRQHYLLNPENVFPSLLVIPSVDVDYSGVLVTTGLGGGGRDDMTAAFSRGAGGAVEGQAAETYLLRPDGSNQLLSPAREPLYRRLPAAGGTEKRYGSFEDFLLTQGDIYQLRLLARDLYLRYPDLQPPYDVECGFKDGKLWLFQVRPFVENKQARGSEYLNQLSGEAAGGKEVPWNSRL